MDKPADDDNKEKLDQFVYGFIYFRVYVGDKNHPAHDNAWK